MKIEIVQLENIRSHTKSTVPFTHGFNCLVGGLGCGKSSVMYAVDFALFGDSIGRSFEYLLREGAESGKVTVQFTHNGSTYKLTRGLKRKGKSINQNIEELKLYEDEKLVASMKTDAIAEQLKAITGLDKDLYREIVWFRQEHLKELLDATPRDRQKRLDELFGLSDYEIAWGNIAQLSAAPGTWTGPRIERHGVRVAVPGRRAPRGRSPGRWQDSSHPPRNTHGISGGPAPASSRSRPRRHRPPAAAPARLRRLDRAAGRLALDVPAGLCLSRGVGGGAWEKRRRSAPNRGKPWFGDWTEFALQAQRPSDRMAGPG